MGWIAALLQILRTVFGTIFARWDAKRDERREMAVEEATAALKRERDRDEVDRGAVGGSARDRLRADWTRPE